MKKPFAQDKLHNSILSLRKVEVPLITTLPLMPHSTPAVKNLHSIYSQYEVWPHLLLSFQPRCQDKCWCCTFLKTTDFWICTSHTHHKHFLSDVVGLHGHELSFSSREEGEGMVWHLEEMSARQQTAPEHFSRLTQVGVFFTQVWDISNHVCRDQTWYFRTCPVFLVSNAVVFNKDLGHFQPCLSRPNLIYFNKDFHNVQSCL